MEILLAASLFGIFLTGIFFLFGRGNRVLKKLDEAGGIQAKMLHIKLLLREDFSLTDLGSVTIQRDNFDRLARDQVTCVAMEDWSRDDNFPGPHSEPRWNRRVAYLSTTNEIGELQRVVFVPDTEALLPRPLTSWLPIAEDQIVIAKTLSRYLREFKAELIPSQQELLFEVTLGEEKGGGDITASFYYSPINTRSRL